MVDTKKHLIEVSGKPISIETTAYIPSAEELAVVNSLEWKRPNPSGNKTTVNTDLLALKSMKGIKEFFEVSFDEYRKDVLQINDNFRIILSWASCNPQHAYHLRHRHQNSVFSMIYYIQQKDGSITFSPASGSPIQEGFNFQYEIESFNRFNAEEWIAPINEHSLMIFPSFLIHSTTPNQHADDRISIVANLFPFGDLGSRNDLTALKIV